MVPKNWRNSDDYTKCKSFGCDRWAWEFLRRNREYQNFYKDLLPKFLKERERYYKENPIDKGLSIYHGHPDTKPSDDDFTIPEAIGHYIPECEIGRWKIYCYPNPNNDNARLTFARGLDSCYIYGGGTYINRNGKKVSIGGLDKIPEGKIAFIVDPECPLDTQLNDIKNHLTEIKKRFEIITKKKVIHKLTHKMKVTWINYLRVLDAQIDIENRSITREQAGKIIFNVDVNGDNAQTFTTTLKAAKKMTKEEYKYIM